MRRLFHAASMISLVAAGMVVTQAARTQHATPVDLLITRARVLDTRSGAIMPGRVIDVAGRHVIPGLWDMHMHFGGGDTLIRENRLLLPLYLAHGVTAVRDAAGDAG